jgi:hypothetical protein
MAGASAACDGLRLPNADDPAPVLRQTADGHGATFSLAPWPLDANVAFLCLRDPSSTFATDHPAVTADEQCVALEVAASDDRLSARFDLRAVPQRLVAAFMASKAPWYLAVGGSRAGSAEHLVTTIEASPIPSDPGPS